MPLPITAALFSLLALAVGGATAQTPASTPAATSAPATSASTTAAAPASALLEPALGNLDKTVGALDLERWKLPRPLRDDTHKNVDSIKQDLQGTLPSLKATTDAAPASVPAELTLLRNIDALYDVALRVAATATLAAPAAQTGALEQALDDLLHARRALADRVQADAVAQEHRVADLQTTLRAGAAAAPVCPAPAPVTQTEPKTKPKRARPRPKPATATPPAAMTPSQ